VLRDLPVSAPAHRWTLLVVVDSVSEHPNHAEILPEVDCCEARQGEVELALHLPDGRMRRATGGVRLGDRYDTLVGFVQVRGGTAETLPRGTRIYSWEPT
jgi:hypothetical protein